METLSKNISNSNNFIQTEINAFEMNFLDSIQNLIFEISLDGKLTYLNTKGLEKYGYSLLDFEDHYNLQIIFPYDYQRLEESFHNIIKGEAVTKNSFQAVKKNGEEITVVVSAQLIRKDNLPVLIRGIIVDISEKNELEDVFQDLFRSSPFPTVILDPQTGEIFMFNTFAKELFAVEPERSEQKSENIFFYVHDYGKQTFRNYIGSVLNSTKSLSYTTQLSNKKGEERQVKIYASKINIEGRQFIQCIFEDRTELLFKKNKEIEQRKQKELLALSVFQLNDYKDKDSMFKYIAQTLNAFNPNSIVAIGDLIPGKNKLKLNCVFGVDLNRLTQLTGLNLSTIEFDVVDYPTPENRMFVDIVQHLSEDKFNKIIPLAKLSLIKKLFKLKKIFTTKIVVNKSMYGGIMIFTPNENFLAENEYIEIFISQAGIILDRIFYENELIEAKEKAIESDRLKSAFLSNMSHEIRTPMNSILGFSDLILNEELTEALKAKYSNLIRNSGDVLVKLIDDIIDISKIESQQLKILNEEFLVNEMLEELKIEYLGTVKQDQLAVELIFTNNINPVVIKSDRSRIKQILNNLLSNSIKFTSKGSIKIWYELKGNHIVFHVKDTGEGIDKEKQSIIFDRFRQADESATRPHRGTGLGLSISKHLANLLNGDIIVNSQKNIGAEFIITLPTNHNSKQKTMEQFIKPHLKTAINWEKYTIFIAEDEESNYLLLEAYLKNTKVNYKWFKNGLDLINALKDQQPDLVLLDLKMPEMDGYTAAVEIKKNYPDLYIIAQTAYAMADEKSKAIKAGCDDFVTKPIKKEVLFYKIGKRLI